MGPTYIRAYSINVLLKKSDNGLSGQYVDIFRARDGDKAVVAFGLQLGELGAGQMGEEIERASKLNFDITAVVAPAGELNRKFVFTLFVVL